MQKLFLIIKEIFSGKFISLIVLTAVTLSVLTAGSFLLIGDNVNRYINDKFASAVPPNMIKVTPKPLPKLGFFNFIVRKPAGTVLDDNALKRISLFKGVKSVYPLMASQIPMQALISIFGLNYRTDLICIGVPYSFISGDIGDKNYRHLWQTWQKGMELPALVPDILLDAYNNSMAEPNGLPRITGDMAVGRQFQILFGKSSIKTIDGFEVEKSTVIGFTGKVANICLVIPLQAVSYYNRRFKGGDAGGEYMTAYIQADNHTEYLKIIDRLKSMKYTVETEKSLSQEILALKSNIGLAIQSVTIIILILSITAIALSGIIAAMDRIDYYRIMRILGASKVFIIFTLILKYALIGWAGASLAFFCLDYILKAIIPGLHIPGFIIKTAIPKELSSRILAAGIIIPAISTIPAFFRLFSKGMSED